MVPRKWTLFPLGKRWLPNKPEASSTDKGRLASYPRFSSLHAEIFILEHFDLGRKKKTRREMNCPSLFLTGFRHKA